MTHTQTASASTDAQSGRRGLEFRMVSVLRARDLTPRMRRLVLGGAELGGFEIPGRALGPYIKLLIPPEDDAGPSWRSTGSDSQLIWPSSKRRSAMRTYSVRAFDRDAQELTVDVVLHGESGVGSRWARRVKPGSTVGLWGPGVMTSGGVDWHILAGDHTALPAIAYILEHLPETARGQAFIEVPDAAEQQPLRHPAGMQLEWLHRNCGAPTSSTLPDRVRASHSPTGARVLVWTGAEAATARAIRHHARRERRLAPDQVHVLNYWKRGAAEGAFDYCA